jgi:hypothetical protein
MADEPEKTEDEDVEGHKYTSKSPDDGKKSSPERFTSKTDEDDVEGHKFTSNTPDEREGRSATEKFTS